MAALAAVSSAREEARHEEFERLKARLGAKAPAVPIESLVPTAIPSLDRLLEGGFPAGIVATLEGERGGWSLAAALMASMTRRSLVAILDDGALYPPALAEAGACLDRVLVVPARKALAMARAADILLRSRICRMVLMPAVALREAVWGRLAKLAHRTGVLLIVVAARAGAALSATAAVRLHCVLERVLVHGRSGLWGTVAGFELSVHVRKHRHMAAGRSALLRVQSDELDAALH
ncbi:MAG: hypothetical protein JOZ77_02290 [Candidatus Eremiobacteraeota bacterium]|nr:hypothetical protein [Candidatus Eremiobacteraeota bacterium]